MAIDVAQYSRAREDVPRDSYAMPATVGRKEFIKWFGRNYKVSQRVTMIGPPGRGKSKLGTQLLKVVISPNCKCVYLAGKIKGRDDTVEQSAKFLNLEVIHEWPPTAVQKYRNRRKNGYILQPLNKAGETAQQENVTLRKNFAGAIHDNYHTNAKHPCITVVDETHQAHNDLKLKEDCEAPLMRGRPDNAVWSFIQRGRFVSYHCYEAENLFIFYDSDRDNQKRYADIGDADPKYIEWVTSKLERKTIGSGEIISQCLYMNRSGYMCIVDT